MRTSPRHQSSIVSSSSSAFGSGILVARPEAWEGYPKLSFIRGSVSRFYLFIQRVLTLLQLLVHIPSHHSENLGLRTASRSVSPAKGIPLAATKPLTRTVTTRATGRVSGPRGVNIQAVERAGIPRDKEVRIDLFLTLVLR